MKAMNQATKPLVGMEKDITMKIGSWMGEVDFAMHLIGEFKMILGMDMLREVNLIPIPYLNSFYILEEGSACVVLAKSKHAETSIISTVQLVEDKMGFDSPQRYETFVTQEMGQRSIFLLQLKMCLRSTNLRWRNPPNMEWIQVTKLNEGV